MAVNAQKIIAEGDINALIDTAQEVGKSVYQQRLTTSQIRNIFGEVRRIEMSWRSNPKDSYRQVVLLLPKIAYQAKRERGTGVAELKNAFDPCLELIRKAPENEREQYFKRFVDFFEAILAYHKQEGGQ